MSATKDIIAAISSLATAISLLSQQLPDGPAKQAIEQALERVDNRLNDAHFAYQNERAA